MNAPRASTAGPPLIVGPVRIDDLASRSVSQPGSLAIADGAIAATCDADAAKPNHPGWVGERPLFVTPGLIDCHAPTLSYEATGNRPRRTAVMATAVGTRNLTLALAYVITTVRDLGAPKDHSIELRTA